MKLYRFSPIKSKEELLEAITYTHLNCQELSKKLLGKYLPVSGNIGIFCHFNEEFEILTKLREELTDASDSWNQKYFRLHEPIVIGQMGDIPKTIYNYLYIRKPDQYRGQVGDVDLVIDQDGYQELKKKEESNTEINGIKLLYKPHIDMLELSHPEIDALAYLTTASMDEKHGLKTN